MSETSNHLLAEQNLSLETALLTEIVTQHLSHFHLTQEELVTRMGGCPSGSNRIAILDSLQELKRSGVIRVNGDVIEPTLAALRTAEIFECP